MFYHLCCTAKESFQSATLFQSPEHAHALHATTQLLSTKSRHLELAGVLPSFSFGQNSSYLPVRIHKRQQKRKLPARVHQVSALHTLAGGLCALEGFPSAIEVEYPYERTLSCNAHETRSL